MKTQIKIFFVFAILLAICTSCKKSWLDAKPNKALVVPSTIQDYQALLDNNVAQPSAATAVFNTNQASLGEVATDEYYLTYSSWQSLSTKQEKNAYIWNADIYQGEQTGFDWKYAYNQILNTNIVLEGIDKITPDANSQAAWNNVKGSALFFRAFNLYGLTQIYCKPYNSTTAGTDLGLPLRLTSNINEKSVRSTLQQAYDQIFQDLKTAKTLLPQSPLGSFPTRPSINGVYALLARIYLSMNDFDKAFLYSDSCLQFRNQLMDFNSLSATATFSINPFCVEDIFHSDLDRYSALNFVSVTIPDSTVYNSIVSNDLRKVMFYRFRSNVWRFWGSYSTALKIYGGLATDEMYLIRAECNARKGNTNAAMADLNTLLVTRWKAVSGVSTFIPYTATSADDALAQILTERRKELQFRGTRWSDLRRLNQDPRFAITLVRILNGQTYTLPPNDKRYVFPIPPDEISLSGIQQNP